MQFTRKQLREVGRFLQPYLSRHVLGMRLAMASGDLPDWHYNRVDEVMYMAAAVEIARLEALLAQATARRLSARWWESLLFIHGMVEPC